MANFVCVDKNIWEKCSDECFDKIYLDERIAPIICKLNQYGYQTTASFVPDLYDGEYMQMVVDDNDPDTIRELARVSYELPKQAGNHVFRVPIISNQLWISFDDIKSLPSLPEGFKIRNNTMYTPVYYVSNFASFFKDGTLDTYLSDYEVTKQIDKIIDNLEKWLESFGK